MSPHHRFCLLVVLILATATQAVLAEEPNNFFGESTVLAPGVFSVDDELTPGDVSYPDTVLGVRGTFGDVYASDDNGSPLGNGLASGLGGVPTNSGSIDFVVSGYPDDGFFGNHGESGQYEVFVDVYDFFDDLVDSFSQTATLEPGNVDEYSYSDFEWIGGSYDVYIDNTVGGVAGADVDFFTFTGLTPGAAFSAETMELGFDEIDTYLGWFDDSGNLLDFNDDIETGNLLSIIEGNVPASGKLTFAVTGYGDEDFLGSHFEDAEYTLQLTVESAEVTGDFDGDSDIDGRDFLIWQRGGSPTSLGASDLAAWQENYGQSLGGLSAVTVPEPSTVGLLALAAGALGLRRSTNR